jgi:transposase
MIGKQSYQSWTISDEFWEIIKPYIPKHERKASREYKRKSGGGRKPPDYREILEKILYVLRTGCQWKSIDKGSNVHRYFQLWSACGFFEGIWAAGLYEYDELKGLDWEWLSQDGCMVKAPLAQESVGSNPTDRGKKRNQTKRVNGRTRSAPGGGDMRS